MTWKYPTNPPLGLASRGEPTPVILTVAGLRLRSSLRAKTGFSAARNLFSSRPAAARCVASSICWTVALAGNRLAWFGDPMPFGRLPPCPRGCRPDLHARWVSKLLACEAEAKAALSAMLEAIKRRQKGLHRAKGKRTKTTT
jgi:hypothetical protein